MRHERVKTHKWYYICNMRSAYFPINGRLIRERERARERETERETEIERQKREMSNAENTETVLCQ